MDEVRKLSLDKHKCLEACAKPRTVFRKGPVSVLLDKSTICLRVRKDLVVARSTEEQSTSVFTSHDLDDSNCRLQGPNRDTKGATRIVRAEDSEQFEYLRSNDCTPSHIASSICSSPPVGELEKKFMI